MMRFKISSVLSIPKEAVTQTFAILAKRGSGKTYTALVMVEEMLKQSIPIVVIDPVGVCWGLRASADGKGPGLPIIVLGGDHGDVPLEPTSGEVIADFVIEHRQSVVLDLSLFRKGEQVRFMTDFSERMYHRNRDPIHMVLDEADAFAPQKPMKGQERMLGAVEDLVRRGRARGIGLTLVTQRAAVLNKDVLTQCEVLITLRVIAPQDRAAIDAWIRVHGTPEERDELMKSLPSLPIGTAWFWSPGWLDLFKKVKVRQRETFDSSATPKIGGRIKAPKRLAKINLSLLKNRIAETIEKQKENDPRALKIEVARLKKELLQLERKRETQVHSVEVPVIKPTEIKSLSEISDKLQNIVERCTQVGKNLEGAITVLASKIASVQKSPMSEPMPRQVPEIYRKKDCPAKDWDPNVQLRAGAIRILRTLAQRHPLHLTRAQLGTLSKFSPRGGTFLTYMSDLRRVGFIRQNGNQEISISEDGLNYLGTDTPEHPKTTKELQTMWKSSLRAGESKMLDTLIDIYPASMMRDELGVKTGFTPTGGTFSTYLSVLRKNGLIEINGNEVKAGETLFL